MSKQTLYCDYHGNNESHDWNNCPDKIRLEEELKAEKEAAQKTLKTCPFCGSSAILDHGTYQGFPGTDCFFQLQQGWWIVCPGEDCRLRFGYHSSDDDYGTKVSGDFISAESAATAWNTRY